MKIKDFLNCYSRFPKFLVMHLKGMGKQQETLKTLKYLFEIGMLMKVQVKFTIVIWVKKDLLRV